MQIDTYERQPTSSLQDKLMDSAEKPRRHSKRKTVVGRCMATEPSRASRVTSPWRPLQNTTYQDQPTVETQKALTFYGFGTLCVEKQGTP